MDLSKIVEFIDNPGDQSYADIIRKPGINYYYKRVVQLGLVGAKDVLDIGCGFGQWAFALGYFNQNVLAVDPTPKRIQIAKKMAEYYGIKNVHFEVAYFNDLNIPDESLDIIFCYGVFMFLNRKDFEIFCRKKLRPNGKVYVCTNSFGWWIRLFLKNLRNGNFSAALTSGKAIWHSVWEGYPNSTTLSRLKKIFSAEFWYREGVDSEGWVSTSKDYGQPLPSYPKEFYGFKMVIEGLFKKKPGVIESESYAKYQISKLLNESVKPNPADKQFLQRANSVQSQNTYIEQMRIFKLATRLDRLQELKNIFSFLTQNLDSDLGRAEKILFFLQNHFIHSFSGQPLMSDQNSIFCPLTVFMLKNVRCGNSARFVVDLFIANGWPARMIQFKNHVCAEVKWNSKWHLFDVDLFDYGHYPKNKSGEWASLEEVIEAPSLLDQVPSYQFAKKETTSVFQEIFSQKECDTPFAEFERVPKASSAYFANWSSSSEAFVVSRLEKIHPVDAWSETTMYGWKDAKTVQQLVTPQLTPEFQIDT